MEELIQEIIDNMTNNNDKEIATNEQTKENDTLLEDLI